MSENRWSREYARERVLASYSDQTIAAIFANVEAHQRNYSDQKKAYHEYLTSPAWLEFRSRIFEERGRQCDFCESEVDINLHHMTYERVGHESDDDVIVVCKVCHEAIHGIDS